MNLLVMCALQLHTLSGYQVQPVPRMLQSLSQTAKAQRSRKRDGSAVGAGAAPSYAGKRFRVRGKSSQSAFTRPSAASSDAAAASPSRRRDSGDLN